MHKINSRGISVSTLNTQTCEVSEPQTFDTYASNQDAIYLAKYLAELPDHTYILGVSHDEASKEFSPVKPVLKLLGVDADNLNTRGKLVFIVLKGHPEITKARIRQSGGTRLVLDARIPLEEDQVHRVSE